MKNTKNLTPRLLMYLLGVGTIIGAVLVGTWLGFFNRHFGPARDRFLKGKETV